MCVEGSINITQRELQMNKECGIMYTGILDGVVTSVFLVTWIEGEEVNYRFVNQREVQPLVASLGLNVIVQHLPR